MRRRPPGAAMMARSRDDAASEIETASIDGDRNMSTSFAREGSGDSARREDSGGFDRRRPDRDPSPFLPMRGAGRGGFSRRSGTSSPLPAAAGGGARGGEHEERSRLWKKADFPTDDALRKCRVHRHEDLPRYEITPKFKKCNTYPGPKSSVFCCPREAVFLDLRDCLQPSSSLFPPFNFPATSTSFSTSSVSNSDGC